MELLGVSERDVEGVLEYINLGNNECSNEYNSIFMTEWDSEWINDIPLLGLRELFMVI